MADDSTLATITDNSTTYSTLDSSQSHSSTSRQLDVTRDELEKRQLMHTIQLLKLEVSQKQLVLESVRNEKATQLEELREKLADASHEKKLLSLRLQSMTHAYEQELKVVKENSRRELTASLEKPQGDVHTREEVEVALQDPYITEDEYHHLASAPNLPLTSYIKMRFHELTQPALKQCEQLQSTVQLLTQQLTARDEELAKCQQELSCSKEQVSELERQSLQQAQELTTAKTSVLEGNYKVDNFDAVQRSRDELKKELETLRLNLEERDARERVRDKEDQKAVVELSSLTQTVGLLKQDKEYLERQVSEAKQRCRAVEDKAELLGQQLEEARAEREKALHRLIHSKEESRVEHEQKLQSEIDGLRARTALEIEQLRTQTREMYERESRSLREAKENAMDERDRAMAGERETSQKYEHLLKEHHTLQAAYEGRVSGLQGELQIANFEREKCKLLNEEMTKDLKHCQLEQEKLHKKVELLTQELWSSESKRESDVRETESRLREVQQRLEGYEKIENELDDIVLQSAQMEHESDAEKVLFSYGFGTSVPTTSRRRLQQSVQLARRVLHLERTNTSLKNQLESEESKSTELQKKLHRSQELLHKSQQPYSCLIEDLQERDAELHGQREVCARLEKEIATLREERAAMLETRNQMASDLERLLNHREELHMIKQVLLGILSKQGKPQQEKDVVTTQSFKPHPLEASSAAACNTPSPTQFTKHEPSKNSRK